MGAMGFRVLSVEIIVVFAMIPTAAAQETPNLSGDELYAILQSERARFPTVSLRYTKTITMVAQPETPAVTRAAWWYRHDGFERLDQERERALDDPLRDQTNWQRVKTPETDTSHSVSSHAVTIQALRRRQWRSRLPGAAMSIWFIGEAPYYESKIRDTLKIHGWEEIDGNRCLKVSFVLTPGSLTEFLWLDPKRGYNALRRENRKKGKTRFAITMRLHEVEDGIWFPIYGHNEMTHAIAETQIDPASIHIGEDIADRVFELEYPSGTRVSDEIAGRSFVVGGRAPVRKPASQKQLDQLITDAEFQNAAVEGNRPANRVEAGALSRSRWRNWPYWTFGTVSMALTISGLVLVLRRR